MTREEAIEFIKKADARAFRYGDLSYVTSKEDAIADIKNMEDLAWNDGEVYEEDTLDCMLEKIQKLEVENAQLKEQLRWRLGTENPEKEGDYLGKWSDYSDPVNLVYKNGKWFMFEDEFPELVQIPQPKYWLPIPPLEV